MASFASQLKADQRVWALASGFETSWFDERHGPSSHVLKPEHKEQNLFIPEWWKHISGKEHRWARALNSSQCFAVNLFAPLTEDQDLARSVIPDLFPGRSLSADHRVNIIFEYTPEDAARWLGEDPSEQGTQVDVAFEISAGGKPRGYVLVEVKLSEANFGGCRGPKGLDKNGKGNPNPEHCEKFGPIFNSPARHCWLAKARGRLYWERMEGGATPFSFGSIPAVAPCPFQHGLYQVMRNRVLADAIVQETEADWADFAVCVHPGNNAAHILPTAVAGKEDVLDAFREIAGKRSVLVIEPAAVIDAVSTHAYEWRKWANWMRRRYVL